MKWPRPVQEISQFGLIKKGSNRNLTYFRSASCIGFKTSRHKAQGLHFALRLNTFRQKQEQQKKEHLFILNSDAMTCYL